MRGALLEPRILNEWNLHVTVGPVAGMSLEHRCKLSGGAVLPGAAWGEPLYSLGNSLFLLSGALV